MPNTPLSKLHTSVETLTEAASKLSNFLGGLKDEVGDGFDFSKKISGKSMSVSEILAMVDFISESTSGSEIDANKLLPIPISRIAQLDGQSNAFRDAVNQLIDYITSNVSQRGGLKSFDYNNFHGHFLNGQAVDFRPQFHQVYDSIDGALGQFTLFSHLIIDGRGKKLGQSTASLARAIAAAAKKVDILDKSMKEATSAAASSVNAKKAAEDSSTETKRYLTEAESDRKTITEYLAESTEKRATITEIHSAALELKSTISEYQGAFEKFQEQLDGRNNSFLSGKEKLDELILKYTDQQKEIDLTIKKSEEMLSSATVSGLAANFHNIMDKLTKELRAARWSFYIGIVFLTISAIPLFILIIEPIVWPFIAREFLDMQAANNIVLEKGPADGLQYLGQIFARC